MVPLPFDLPTFIRAVGYLGIALVVFADTGLLLGLLLPGDSLLFTAGLLASLNPPVLNIWGVMRAGIRVGNRR